ncbi:MAG TPA: hypothetical protein VIY48_05535 [Candidatus Paceibacterota bacterium]
MFDSIEDLKQANEDAGYHWFDKGAMEFFDTIVYPELIQHPEGAYFISSERFDSSSPRLFTVRFTRFSGETNTVGPFQGFNSQVDALRWASDHSAGREN